MKTLYLNRGNNICIDPENDYVDSVQSERESIDRIYLAKEPMHVVYGNGTYKRELDVKKDDLIITFYTDDFEERVVVAKSKDWVKNLKKYNEESQRLKEEWAAKQAESNLCEACCDCLKCEA